MEFRFPIQKLHEMNEFLLAPIRKKKVILLEMQSLLGLFAFATRVLPVGKIFSSRLYILIYGLKSPTPHVRDTLTGCVNVEKHFGTLQW